MSSPSKISTSQKNGVHSMITRLMEKKQNTDEKEDAVEKSESTTLFNISSMVKVSDSVTESQKVKEYTYIFDFDGTLCDSNLAVHFCIGETLRKNNISFDVTKMNEAISKGFSLDDTFSYITSISDSDIIKNFVVTYREIYNSGEGLKNSKLFPGVYETLKHLQDKNFRIIVVSNKGEKSVKEALDHFNLMQFVDDYIADRPGVKKKPDPMIFTDIIKKKYNSLSNEKVMMIGDTEADILFSSNIFVSSCWVNYGYGDKDKCVSLKPTFILSSIDELIKISHNHVTEQQKLFIQES